MSVLLNTFRPRNVNPEHYDQKMKFWKEMIENYCEYKGSSRCTIQELKTVFKRNGTSPYCLQDVFNEMISEGNLVNKDEFMREQKTGWGSWAVDSLVVRPLSWGLGKIKEKLVTNVQDDQSFVVLSAVKSQSMILQEHARTRKAKNNIISMDELMNGTEGIDGVSPDGILLALQYLSTVEKQVYVEEHKTTTDSTHHHKLLLKFADPHQRVLPITEMERSIYNLEQTEKFLLETIEKKEEQLNSVLKQVKDCLKEGKKQIAKTYLRKKHLMELDLTKSVNILDNVQTMLQRVNASKNDKEILSTYKMGSDAIKIAFANSGVNLDNVHDIIEDMQEIYGDQAEYEAAISEPLRGTRDVDDSVLEKELMELMQEDTETKTNIQADADNKNKNAGAATKPPDDKIEDLDFLDRELELRLKRLRSDFSDLDESQTTTRLGPVKH